MNLYARSDWAEVFYFSKVCIKLFPIGPQSLQCQPAAEVIACYQLYPVGGQRQQRSDYGVSWILSSGMGLDTTGLTLAFLPTEILLKILSYLTHKERNTRQRKSDQLILSGSEQRGQSKQEAPSARH